ncbi:MAG: hypothetical protein JSU73_10385 [candidate division WOR-3 bacterium]|nr:MAG: hypothetical protein JSU73_10385 [candidate division WOR-3 bacterium]
MDEQPDAGKPVDDQGSGTDAVPKLVFQPDKARQARIRKTRALAAWLTLGGLAVALVWLATYRPRLLRKSDESELPAEASAVPAAGPGSSANRETSGDSGLSKAVSSLPEPAAAEQASFSPTETADDIGRLARSALSRWSLVLDVTLAEELSPDRAQDMLDLLAPLRTQLDSADADVAGTQNRVADVGRATRTVTGNAYKLSVLYVASEKVAEELGKQAGEIRDYFESIQAALRAAAAGEDGEFEVKVNVANGHLKRVEMRDRLIGRRLRSLKQVAGEVEG